MIGSQTLSTPSVSGFSPLMRNFKSLPSSFKPAEQSRLVVGDSHPITIQQTGIGGEPFETRVFDALVALKVAISQYAMHLSSNDRHKLFDQLDFVVNVDDWHEEDALPVVQSFQNFLKWIVYTKNTRWSSVGFDDEGMLLVAWKTRNSLLTANFGAKAEVTWTARRDREESGQEIAAGRYSLKFFAKQCEMYLDE